MTDIKITLASARVNKGLTQTDVAKMLGVSIQTVSLWERKPSIITISNAYKLAELYGVDIDNLVFSLP